MRISEIQMYRLDDDSRVELPDDARIIAVVDGVVQVEVVIERFNDHR